MTLNKIVIASFPYTLLQKNSRDINTACAHEKPQKNMNRPR